MTNKKTIKIAVLPGDGIGREVTSEAVKVFDALNVPVEIEYGDIGWEFWKKEGNPVPQRTWDLIKRTDVTLLGAITSMPKREAENSLPLELQGKACEYSSPIIQLRQNLDLFVNVRPCFNVQGSVKSFNFVIIRENTEGLYAGFDYHPIPTEIHPLLKKRPNWKDKDYSKISASLRLQSEDGLRRLFNFSFEYAKKNKFNRVTFADKPNVLRQSSAYARSLFEEVAKGYPHIKADIHNVDAVALWMVKRPEEFGVIVAENMFGDILSDLGAGVMGGLGFAPSANIGNKGAYFEPVHGSAPRVKSGKPNPCAMFLTCAMLLEHCGYIDESQKIFNAVNRVIKAGKSLTYDLGGNSTTKQMAKAILDNLSTEEHHKTIGLLATGSELLNGDIKESNMHTLSTIISGNGGIIRNKNIVSDFKTDISKQLAFLLDQNDAVITIGGLGPTSDDNTRFAISDLMKTPLEFDNSSWEHISERFKKFGLKLNVENKKQAMFPKDSKVLPNNLGTANGCHINYNGKDIFMLPGPPKETVEVFSRYVAEYLSANDYFSDTKQYNYLTLGLIEGEISAEIDKALTDSNVEVAYCWKYPYLEIKIKATPQQYLQVKSEIENILSENLVTSEKIDILESTNLKLETLENDININLNNDCFHLINLLPSNKHIRFNSKANTNISFDLGRPKESYKRTLTLNFTGKVLNGKTYAHTLTTPDRDSDIEKYIAAYFIWQFNKFLDLILEKK